MKRSCTLVVSTGALSFLVAFVSAAGREEIVSMRTECCKVFDNGDGCRTVEISNHPVHVKNAQGKWVDINTGGSRNTCSEQREIIPNPTIFTAKTDGERYESRISPYHSAVGWEAAVCGPPAKPAASREWKTFITFYLASFITTECTDAYYEINHPVIRSDGRIHVFLCGENPRNIPPQSLFRKFGDAAAAGITVSAGEKPIRVTYDGMAGDIASLSDNCITFCHASENLISVSPSTLGDDAVLYLTFGFPDAKSSHDAVSIKAFPNPFNSRTVMEISLEKNADVNLDIYNAAGQKIESMLRGRLSAGKHSVSLNAGLWATGVYFYRLRADNSFYTGKLLLVR